MHHQKIQHIRIYDPVIPIVPEGTYFESLFCLIHADANREAPVLEESRNIIYDRKYGDVDDLSSCGRNAAKVDGSKRLAHGDVPIEGY